MTCVFLAKRREAMEPSLSSRPRAKRLLCCIRRTASERSQRPAQRMLAPEAELMAIFGWTAPKVAVHYTRTANRNRLTTQAKRN
jgi:hypothetical protein